MQLGYTITELTGAVETGTVTYKKVSGPGSDFSVALSGAELSDTTHAQGDITNQNTINSSIVDSTLYNIVFTSVDSAGNTGLDSVTQVKYDISNPRVSLSFSDTLVRGDSTVLMTATFSEILDGGSAPQVMVKYADGAGTVFDDLEYVALNDSSDDASIWYLSINIPSSFNATGNVLINFDSTSVSDFAENQLDSIAFSNVLVIDNTGPTGTLSYLTSAFEADTDRLWGNGGDGVTVTVEWDEPAVISPGPRLVIDYVNSADQIVDHNEYEGNDTVWTYQISSLSSDPLDDGRLSFSVEGTDIANNAMSVYVNNDTFLLDNVAPVILNVLPGDTSFVNTSLIGYTITDTNGKLESGNIAFKVVSGPGSNFDLNLADTEIDTGTHAQDSLTNHAVITASIVDSTLYNLVFTTLDSAGNTGSDTVKDVTYDVSRPYAGVSFGRSFGSGGMEDTVTAVFSEKMTATPKILVYFGPDTVTTIEGDMAPSADGDSVWIFPFIIPDNTDNDGMVHVWFGRPGGSMLPTDYAGNTLRSPPALEGADSVIYLDTLIIDNIERSDYSV